MKRDVAKLATFSALMCCSLIASADPIAVVYEIGRYSTPDYSASWVHAATARVPILVRLYSVSARLEWPQHGGGTRLRSTPDA